MSSVDESRFPEWAPFAEAVAERDPRTGTWCEAWTVGDITAAQERLSQPWMTDHSVRAVGAPLLRKGIATLETDASTRVLLLWGRRPADPSKLSSNVGAVELGRIRTLLSGY